ncbi:unnamed protein product, partial [Ectocarpus sp. 8 AP-2014]
RALTTTYHTQKIKDKKQTTRQGLNTHGEGMHAPTVGGFQLRGLTGGLKSPTPASKIKPSLLQLRRRKGGYILAAVGPSTWAAQTPPKAEILLWEPGVQHP